VPIATVKYTQADGCKNGRGGDRARSIGLGHWSVELMKLYAFGGILEKPSMTGHESGSDSLLRRAVLIP
jgi:hypothetical protein